ncbi:unnamed protein product, partial [Discosporangium mesarthrocarpum]
PIFSGEKSLRRKMTDWQRVLEREDWERLRRMISFVLTLWPRCCIRRRNGRGQGRQGLGSGNSRPGGSTGASGGHGACPYRGRWRFSDSSRSQGGVGGGAPGQTLPADDSYRAVALEGGDSPRDGDGATPHLPGGGTPARTDSECPPSHILSGTRPGQSRQSPPALKDSGNVRDSGNHRAEPTPGQPQCAKLTPAKYRQKPAVIQDPRPSGQGNRVCIRTWFHGPRDGKQAQGKENYFSSCPNSQCAYPGRLGAPGQVAPPNGGAPLGLRPLRRGWPPKMDPPFPELGKFPPPNSGTRPYLTVLPWLGWNSVAGMLSLS